MCVTRPARIALLIAAACAAPANAQESNAGVLGALVAECLSPVAGDAASIRFEGLDAYPFLRSAAYDAFREAGVTVWAADAENGVGPRVSTVAEHVETAYAAVGRGSVRRTLTLRLRTVVTAEDGRIVRDEPCERSVQDVVPRSALPSLEDPAFPSTRAEAAPSGFVGRILRPAVVVAASAAGVFLFFSLRSRRANDGS